MPKVPLLSGQQVAQQAAPAAQVSASLPSGSAMGEGIMALGAGISDYEAKEKAKADDVAVEEAATSIKRQRIDSFGEFNKLGLDALLQASDAVESDYTKYLNDVRGALTPDQQIDFDRYANRESLAMHVDVQRRVGEESIHKEDSANERFATTAYTDAGQAAATGSVRLDSKGNVDDMQVRRVIDDLIDRRTSYYGRNAGRFGGMAMAQQMAGDTLNSDLSRVHAAVLDQLGAARQDRVAAAYFAKNQHEMLPDDIKKYRPDVEQGSFLGNVQRAVDSAYLANSNTDDGRSWAQREESALGAVGATFADDPKARKQAESDVTFRYQRAVRLEEQGFESDFNEFKKGLAQGFPLKDAEATKEWKRLPQDKQDALRLYAEDIALGVTRPGDMQVYGDLVQGYASDNPAVREAALKVSPEQLEAEGKLSAQQRMRLVPRRNQLLAEARGDAKADSTGNSFRTVPQIVRAQTAILFGNKAFKEQKEVLTSQFTALVEDLYYDFMDANEGKKPDDKWVTDKVNALAAQKVLDTDYVNELLPLFANTDLTEIPAMQLQSIYEKLGGTSGKTVDEEDILSEWERMQEELGL